MKYHESRISTNFSLLLTIITDNMGMDQGTIGDTGPNDFPRDIIEDDERKVVAIANAIAPSLVFNSVALPSNLPEHLKAALIAKADQDRDAASEAGFVMAAADRIINGQTPEEREKERQEKSLSFVALFAEEIEEQRQREEAHYAEWRQSSQTYAGQTMDGEQWHRLMNWFRDPGNVAAWEDAMMTETGQSRDEVRQTGGKMKRFYDLMEKDAKGTMSDTERGEFKKLNDDSEIKRGVEVQQVIQGFRKDRELGPSLHSEQLSDTSQTVSAKSFASTFADEANISGSNNLPALTSVYGEAANGKQKPSPPEPSASPGLPPAQIVHVGSDNMFG
jgi:hypothetical protein